MSTVINDAAVRGLIAKSFSPEALAERGVVPVPDGRNHVREQMDIQVERVAAAENREKFMEPLTLENLRASRERSDPLAGIKRLNDPVTPERAQELANERVRDTFPDLWQNAVGAARELGPDAVLAALREAGHDGTDRRLVALAAEIRRTAHEPGPDFASVEEKRQLIAQLQADGADPSDIATMQAELDEDLEGSSAFWINPVKKTGAEYVKRAAAERGERAQPKYEALQNMMVEGTRALGSIPLNVGKSVSIATGYLYDPANLIEGSAEDNMIGLDALRRAEKIWNAALPQDDARAEDFLTTLGQGFGSSVAFLLAGAAGAPVLLVGAGAQGSAGYEEAVAMNGTALQKYMAFMLNLGLGTTEAIPIDRMFGRMAADYGHDRMVTLLSNSAASSLEEFMQEFGQAAGEDFIAKYFAGYDPNREIDPKDWVKQGAVGGIVGAGAGAVTTGVGFTLGQPVATPDELTMTAEDIQTAVDEEIAASTALQAELTDIVQRSAPDLVPVSSESHGKYQANPNGLENVIENKEYIEIREEARELRSLETKRRDAWVDDNPGQAVPDDFDNPLGAILNTLDYRSANSHNGKTRVEMVELAISLGRPDLARALVDFTQSEYLFELNVLQMQREDSVRDGVEYDDSYQKNKISEAATLVKEAEDALNQSAPDLATPVMSEPTQPDEAPAAAETPDAPDVQDTAPDAMVAPAVKTDTPEFKEWFGDSKVVDEGGAPLVVYHGTGAGFEAFDIGMAGSSAGSPGETAAFFTSNPITAEGYARVAAADGGAAQMVPVYLSLQNPAVSDRVAYNSTEMAAEIAAAKDAGHDGITFPKMTYAGEDGTFAAFSPTQIKSVNNRGTFDANDPNILAMARSDTAERTPFKGERTRPESGISDTQSGEEPVALRQIADSLRALLGLVVRQGRLTAKGGKGEKVMGQYDQRQATVRLRTFDDIATLFHEAGHALHDNIGATLAALIGTHRKAIGSIARTYYEGDLTKATKAKVDREGFAEFFRLFTSNRDEARRVAPDLTDDFANLLRTEAPELARGIDLIGEMQDRYITQSSLQAARAMVVDGAPPGDVANLMQDLREKGWTGIGAAYFNKFIAEPVVDKIIPLRQITAKLLNATERNGTVYDLKVADDPAKMAQVARNVSAKAMVEVKEGVQDFASFRPASRSLQEALYISQGIGPDGRLGKVDEAVEKDFATYLVLLRALDEYRLGRIDRAPIRLSKGEVRQALADLDRQYGPRFADASAIVHEYGMALWKKQYDAGLMTKEVYETGLERKFYAPLQRDMRGKQGAVGKAAQAAAASQPSNLNKRFRGSDRDIIDPMAVLVQKTFAVEQAIIRNEIKRKIAKLADQAGKAGGIAERIPAHTLIGKAVSLNEVARGMTGLDAMSDVDAADLVALLQPYMDQKEFIQYFRAEQANAFGENITFFFEDGKLQALQLTDEDLGADVINLVDALGYEKLDLFGAEFISRSTSLFRSAVTKWPDFIMVNFTRDQAQTWLSTDVGFIPFLDGARGIISELWQKDVAKSYNSTMGILGGSDTAAVHGAQIERDLNALKGKGYIGNTFEPGVTGFIKGMARLTEFSESGTRMGLWAKAYERAKAEGLSDYEAGIEAAFMATDIMDFGLNGDKTLLFRRTIPFLNAQVQGLYKLWRVLGNTEVARRKGYAYALTAYFKSVDNLALTRAEKQSVNVGRKAWIKMTMLSALSGFITYLLRDDEDFQETSEYMRATGWVIPAAKMGGPENEIIYIPKPFEWALMSNFFERAVEHAYGDRAAMDRFWRGAVMNLTPPASPPLIKTFIEDKFNHNLFFDRDIIPFWQESEIARDPQLAVSEYTSEIAKKIGAVTGWRPMTVDHYLRNLGASAARDLINLTNAAAPQRGELDKNDTIILRRFLRETAGGSTVMTDFWNFINGENGGLDGAAAAYDKHLAKGNPDATAAYMSTLNEDEKRWALLNEHFTAAEKRLHPMRRMRDLSSVISGMRKEMISDLGLADTTGDDVLATISLTKKQKTLLDDQLQELRVREARNTLIFMGYPGWDDKEPTDLGATLAAIREINPAVADEFERRKAEAKVYSGQTIRDFWPDVSARLDGDGEEAYLEDLSVAAKGEL